jgi:hypothetical protein
MRTADARAALERCEPRLPLDEVREWADRYRYRGDIQHVIEDISPAVRERGYFTREEFLSTYRWKTERTAARPDGHTEAEIADVTAVAFRQDSERLRISLLRALDRVDWPTETVLLHVGLSEQYPIIDYRALWSRGSGEPNNYSYGFWWAYVECCRRLAAAVGVSVREFDKALWAFSEANQTRGTR